MRKVLIELYSDMPTNGIEDYKPAGDFILTDSIRAIKIMDKLVTDQVEFTVWQVGECFMDLSYKYWEN